MKYYWLASFGLYALAKDIEELAVSKGYKPNRDDRGNTHPGRDCNDALSRILKDPGLSNKYRLRPEDNVSIISENCAANEEFIQMLVDNGTIHPSTVQHGKLDLFSVKAAEAILGVFLGDVSVYLKADAGEIVPKKFWVSPSPKNIEKKANQKKHSILNNKKL